jgi:hypothetical protein
MRDDDRKERADEVVKAIDKFVNDLSLDDREIADLAARLCGNHRTLQQTTGRIVLSMLQHWDLEYRSHRYDDRNEAICKVAHEMVDYMKRHYGDYWYYLPMI